MEVEIKLQVRPEIPGGPSSLFAQVLQLETLGGHTLGPVWQQHLRDLYYDTADGRLASMGAGIRLRALDQYRFVTLKRNRSQDGALTTREEWERPLTQDNLDCVMAHLRDLLGDGNAPSVTPFAAGHATGGLLPVLDVRTERSLRLIDSQASLMLDLVTYPGLAAVSFFDIEIESHRGEVGVPLLRAAAEALIELAGGFLIPTVQSKLERGLRLQAGQ